jgi:predicted alpha/beta superfamily hydrolase
MGIDRRTPLGQNRTYGMYGSLRRILLVACLGSGLGCGGSGFVPSPSAPSSPPPPSPIPPPPPPGPPGSPDPAVDKPGHTFTGDVRVHQVFHSSILNNDRTYWVSLPPQYATNLTQRFPVLYLGDGLVMFDSTLAASVNNLEWRVDETAERLIRAGTIPPLIIVAVAVNVQARWYEYTPTYDSVAKTGGKAALYERMLIEELKREVDQNYRTLTDAPNTAVGGSSLGGLLSAYLARTRPDVFGKVMAMSPTFAWDNRVEAHALVTKTPTRYWVDTGSLEVSPAPKAFADSSLGLHGWLLGRDYQWYVGLNQDHNVLAWRARMDPALRFLYGQ